METSASDAQRAVRTLSDGDVIRIVRAQPGHFHPDVIASAQVEAERRRLTLLLEKLAARDAARRAPTVEKDDEFYWWPYFAVAFAHQVIKSVLLNWLAPNLASAVAFTIAWLGAYWLFPRKERAKGWFRTRGFLKWALLSSGGGIFVYLMITLTDRFWP